MVPVESRIYYVNKPHDAAGFGHAGVLIPGASSGYTYHSFYASRKLIPICAGTLLTRDFPRLADAFVYARSEGYTREVHWRMDPSRADAARAVLTEHFATGTWWRLVSRNCWDAVHAALRAAGVQVSSRSRIPNRNFEQMKSQAEGWSYL